MMATGLSSLRAMQRALDTTAHNIANVSTPGYTRQTVDFSARKPDASGNAWIGTGVNANSVRRVYDQFVNQQVRSSSGNLARLETGMAELDRVLGGGLIPGSVTLLGGEPGIGKSTLLLQLANHAARSTPTLYLSAEESAAQIGVRARRLGISVSNLRVVADTDLESTLQRAREERVRLLIVDSIQTVQLASVGTAAGAVTQLRECTAQLVRFAKAEEITVLLIGFISIRVQVLTVQDRVIRLEMRLRLRALLPADLAARAEALPVKQLIALRFACDAELPDLVGEIVAWRAQKLTLGAPGPPTSSTK
jgi:hypothetical protein